MELHSLSSGRRLRGLDVWPMEQGSTNSLVDPALLIFEPIRVEFLHLSCSFPGIRDRRKERGPELHQPESRLVPPHSCSMKIEATLIDAARQTLFIFFLFACPPSYFQLDTPLPDTATLVGVYQTCTLPRLRSGNLSISCLVPAPTLISSRLHTVSPTDRPKLN